MGVCRAVAHSVWLVFMTVDGAVRAEAAQPVRQHDRDRNVSDGLITVQVCSEENQQKTGFFSF